MLRNDYYISTKEFSTHHKRLHLLNMLQTPDERAIFKLTLPLESALLYSFHRAGSFLVDRSWRVSGMETYIGVVKHFYNHLGVAVLSLSGDLKAGEVVHILGHSTDFFQEAWSLEVDHRQVEEGRAGEDVAMKLIGPVREGDKIFLSPEAKPTDPLEIEEQLQDEWAR
jgi:hypothetical protein